jgi:hypothetical protein
MRDCDRKGELYESRIARTLPDAWSQSDTWRVALIDKGWSLTKADDVPMALAIWPRCLGSGWTCEDHPNLPMNHEADCGAGMPCQEPRCPFVDLRVWPDPPER